MSDSSSKLEERKQVKIWKPSAQCMRPSINAIRRIFEENVKVTDKETIIFSENLDLLASESFAKAYNEVKLNHPSGLLQADQVDYDFETKYFKVSMFGEELVKMKVTQ